MLREGFVTGLLFGTRGTLARRRHSCSVVSSPSGDGIYSIWTLFKCLKSSTWHDYMLGLWLPTMCGSEDCKFGFLHKQRRAPGSFLMLSTALIDTCHSLMFEHYLGLSWWGSLLWRKGWCDSPCQPGSTGRSAVRNGRNNLVCSNHRVIWSQVPQFFYFSTLQSADPYLLPICFT